MQEVLDLKQTNEVWLLLLRRVRGYVDDDGKLVRPYLLLLYEIAPNTIRRDVELVMKNVGYFPSPNKAMKVLVGAMKRALDSADFKQPPHRPSTIIFTSKYLYHHLQRRILNELEINVKLWTEEENQGFGDDFVVEYSKKLVAKQGFGKGNEKAGLLSIEGANPEMVGGFYKATTNLFKSDPWSIFAKHNLNSDEISEDKDKEEKQNRRFAPYVFVIRWEYELRFFHLFLQTGTREPGILMEKDWDHIFSIITKGQRSQDEENRPKTKPWEDCYRALFFTKEECIPFDDLEAIERYEWPLPFGKLGVKPEPNVPNWLPHPVCFDISPPNPEQMYLPQRRDLNWFEVASFALSEFTNLFKKGNISTENGVSFSVLPISIRQKSHTIKIGAWKYQTKDNNTINDIREYIESELKQAKAPACKICLKKEGLDIKELKRCGNCKIKLYCSQACQLAHWKVHKEECNKLSVQR